MTRKQSIFFLLTLFIIVVVGAMVLLYSLPNGKSFHFFEKWRKSIFQQELAKNEGVFLIKRVVDGDTIELDDGPASTRLGEAGEKVRYIGINTPESVDSERPVECFGKEATEFNKNLVEGKTVRLERDISDRDKYGRLLRYVYLEDGTFVNKMLVREGYAFVATYPPDIAKQDIFRKAEQLARSEKKGLWSETTCNGKK